MAHTKFTKFIKGVKHARRWTFTSLQILGSRCTLNSSQLIQLIGARPSTLHTLALANCPYITPALLNFLASSQQGLQHIR